VRRGGGEKEEEESGLQASGLREVSGVRSAPEDRTINWK